MSELTDLLDRLEELAEKAKEDLKTATFTLADVDFMAAVSPHTVRTLTAKLRAFLAVDPIITGSSEFGDYSYCVGCLFAPPRLHSFAYEPFTAHTPECPWSDA